MEYSYVVVSHYCDESDPPYSSLIKASSMREAVNKLLDVRGIDATYESLDMANDWDHEGLCFDGLDVTSLFSFSIARSDYFLENRIEG